MHFKSLHFHFISFVVNDTVMLC